jgi:hypothetical protein
MRDRADRGKPTKAREGTLISILSAADAQLATTKSVELGIQIASFDA